MKNREHITITMSPNKSGYMLRVQARVADKFCRTTMCARGQVRDLMHGLQTVHLSMSGILRDLRERVASRPVPAATGASSRDGDGRE